MIKDKLYESICRFLENSYLLEMAISRSKVESILHPQLDHIATHYLKIKALPNHDAVNHWKGEIKGAFSKFTRMKYAHNNKRPTFDQWKHHIHHTNLS